MSVKMLTMFDFATPIDCKSPFVTCLPANFLRQKCQISVITSRGFSAQDWD